MGKITWVAIAIYVTMLIIQFIVTGLSQHIEMNIMTTVDARLKLMNEILTGIRVIKYYCWEKPFKGKIMDIRNKELHYHRNMGFVMGIGVEALMSLIPQIVPLVCFSIYPSVMKKPLTSSVAYTSFSLYDASNAFCYDSYGISCLCPIQCISYTY